VGISHVSDHTCLQECTWVSQFKFCLLGSRTLNLFQIESENHNNLNRKKSLKIVCRNDLVISLRQIFVTDFSDNDSKILKYHSFSAQLLLYFLVLEPKIVLTLYSKSYPRNLKMCSYLIIDLYFKVTHRL
jgi:hypothetical protein